MISSTPRSPGSHVLPQARGRTGPITILSGCQTLKALCHLLKVSLQTESTGVRIDRGGE